MKLSVIIPCYNESKTIRSIVDAVLGQPYDNKEIIIVDDASTDGTTDVLRKEIAPFVDKIFYHEKNQGKGAALKTGINAATGDIILIQDADLEYDPMEYPNLLNPILQNKADVVFGSRFYGWEASPCSVFLASGREWFFNPDFKHVYQSESDRYGNLLQSVSSGNHSRDMYRGEQVWF